MLLAQFSDAHLLADPRATIHGRNTAETLMAVVQAFPRRPDVAVVTGDLAEDGAPGAYHQIRALTAGLAPEVHFVAGNHDDPAAMTEVLGEHTGLRMVPLSVTWTMALVSSQWPGHDAGRITDRTLAALEAELRRTRSHVVLCLHHPPLSPCERTDCRLVNVAPLLRALRGGPVRAVLSGHVHRQFERSLLGIRFLGAPSTFRQLRHGGWPHYKTTPEPPAARLIELHDDGSLTHHLVCAPGPVFAPRQ